MNRVLGWKSLYWKQERIAGLLDPSFGRRREREREKSSAWSIKENLESWKEFFSRFNGSGRSSRRRSSSSSGSNFEEPKSNIDQAAAAAAVEEIRRRRRRIFFSSFSFNKKLESHQKMAAGAAGETKLTAFSAYTLAIWMDGWMDKALVSANQHGFCKWFVIVLAARERAREVQLGKLFPFYVWLASFTFSHLIDVMQ